MRSIDLNGILQRARRFVSRPSSASAEEVKDPNKLAEIIRQLSLRVQELEARTPPEAIEIAMQVEGSPVITVDYRFTHGLGTNVRWYPVYWYTDRNHPIMFSQEEQAEDMNSVVLRAFCHGTVIMRFEPTSYTYG